MENPEFEQWFYSIKSTQNPNIPMGTELLFGFCHNDPEKFEVLCNYLQEAFQAGVNSGRVG